MGAHFQINYLKYTDSQVKSQKNKIFYFDKPIKRFPLSLKKSTKVRQINALLFALSGPVNSSVLMAAETG